MAISSELEQLLASWIPRQSWFPKLAADFGTDPDITPMSVARAFTFTAEELGGFSGLVTVISVGDGPTLRRLNIPLSLRGAEDIHLRHALIGTVDDLALGRVFVYDGAADPVFVNLLADAIVGRKVFDGGQLSTESLRHSRERGRVASAGRAGSTSGSAAPASGGASTVGSGAEAVPPKPSTAAPLTEVKDEIDVEIRPIEVADSGAHKSTVIIHDAYEPVELSFFRVLEDGMPSSLTIPVLLTEAGSRSVPEVIGWSSGRWYDMFEVTEMEAPMALLSHTDVEAEPAWREAVDIVCSVDSGSIGGYNAQAAEMGRRIGELHADMAAEFGIVEGRGEPTRQLVGKWIERIDWALGRAPLALDSLVPELKQHKAKLRSLSTIGQLQKIHGELTLDHVVSSPNDGYTVVKFTDSSNSDPRPVAIDLVALLRSVDYAAGFARLQRTEALDSEDGGLVVNGFGDNPAALRAIYDSPEYLWASQVQNSLLSGYSRARGESIGLSHPVLRAALIDRLLVEVVTELRNRPNWLSVPLATLTLILKGRPARGSGEPTEAELSVPASAGGNAEGPADEVAGDEVAGDGAAVAESTAVDDVVHGADGGAAGDEDVAVDEPGSQDDGSLDADERGIDPDEAGSDDAGAGTGAAFVVGAAGVASAAASMSDEGEATVEIVDDDDVRQDRSSTAEEQEQVSIAGEQERVSTDDDSTGDDSADESAAGTDPADEAISVQANSVGEYDDTVDPDVEATDTVDADVEAADTVMTEGEQEPAEDRAAAGDWAAAGDTDADTTDAGDSQVAMVDAVTAETVEPQQGEIAEMVPDSGGFVEPSVEAPTEVPAGSTESAKTVSRTAVDSGRIAVGRPEDGGPSAAADSPSPDDAVTTSVRGTTVTRTAFVGQAGAASATSDEPGQGNGSDAEAVRISGGASIEESYVDAVTTETVERVDDGVPEVDLGVHGQAEPNVEAPERDSEADFAESESAESPRYDGTGEETGAATVTAASDSETLPDAPPLPPEPEEPPPQPLPDAPAVGTDSRAADSVHDADDEEFEEEEETDFVPSRVPATFAARGATSADADSTGRSPHERHKHDGGESHRDENGDDSRHKH